jgi:hypothetical protein
MTPEEAYQLLAVPRTADVGTIRRAYLKLVKAHPPERDPDGFQRVRKAFELASSSNSWQAYAPPHERLEVQEAAERESKALSTGPRLAELDSIVENAAAHTDAFDSAVAEEEAEPTELGSNIEASVGPQPCAAEYEPPPRETPAWEKRLDNFADDSPTSELIQALLEAEQDGQAESAWYEIVDRLYSTDRENEEESILKAAFAQGAHGLEKQMLYSFPEQVPLGRLLELTRDVSCRSAALHGLVRLKQYRLAANSVEEELEDPSADLDQGLVSVSVDTLLGLEADSESKRARSLRRKLADYLARSGRDYQLPDAIKLKWWVAQELGDVPANVEARSAIAWAYPIFARGMLSTSPEKVRDQLLVEERRRGEARALGQFLKERNRVLEPLFGETLRLNESHSETPKWYQKPGPVWIVVAIGLLRVAVLCAPHGPPKSGERVDPARTAELLERAKVLRDSGSSPYLNAQTQRLQEEGMDSALADFDTLKTNYFFNGMPLFNKEEHELWTTFFDEMGRASCADALETLRNLNEHRLNAKQSKYVLDADSAARRVCRTRAIFHAVQPPTTTEPRTASEPTIPPKK